MHNDISPPPNSTSFPVTSPLPPVLPQIPWICFGPLSTWKITNLKYLLWFVALWSLGFEVKWPWVMIPMTDTFSEFWRAVSHDTDIWENFDTDISSPNGLPVSSPLVLNILWGIGNFLSYFLFLKKRLDQCFPSVWLGIVRCCSVFER